MFCSSLWICLILVAIAIKSHCFWQPDGISITLREEDACTAQRILYVHCFLRQKFMRNMFTRGKGVSYIYCCLCLEM